MVYTCGDLDLGHRAPADRDHGHVVATGIGPLLVRDLAKLEFMGATGVFDTNNPPPPPLPTTAAVA